MNLNQAWTGTLPRLAGCALSLVLATSAGCAIEDLASDPSEQPNDLDQGRPQARVADAGIPPEAHGYDAHVPRPPPDSTTCQVDAGAPGSYFDASIYYPPKPGEVDASVNRIDATVLRDCFGTLIGDGKTCLSDTDLRDEGEKLCGAKGFVLAGLKRGESDCAGGGTEGWVSCCTSELPPEPTASSCMGGTIGDRNACIDWSSLKLEASKICEALGATLTGLAGSSDDKCPDGVLYAKYECCKSVVLPRPVDAGAEPWLK